MYSLNAYRNLGRVVLGFDGEMTQNPAHFFSEFSAAANDARLGRDDWDLLIDFSQTPVMPQDRAQNTARIFAWCLDNAIRKIAVVTANTTQRMQMRRVTERSEKLAFFDSSHEAETWLSE